jgi:ribosomal protein S12 methylthiotransferase accessory factor
MQSIPIERSQAIGEARSTLESTLRNYGIDWKIEVAGQYIRTAKCVLQDDSGGVLDYGYGKGDAEAATTGAMFEATEHWFSQFPNSYRDNVLHCESLEFIKNTTFSNHLPISIIEDSPNATMAFREYRQIGRCESIIYPLALSSPKYIDDLCTNPSKYPPDCFDYSQIDRYCSNSGVAIGSNEFEATIHGLLEAVERDTLSGFLVDAFLTRNSSSLRVINRASLPEDLRTLVGRVECEVKHRVLLLELENDFGIPVFCTALHKSCFPIEITGYGCSLSREHAAYRSLHELVQCYHATAWFHPEEFDIKAKSILSKFEKFSFHRRCAQLKLAEWCEEIGFLQIDFSSAADVGAPTDLSLYLRNLTKTIEFTGRHAYSAIVNQLAAGQVITHSFIEAQDHFFCVTEGCFVFPNRKDMV